MSDEEYRKKRTAIAVKIGMAAADGYGMVDELLFLDALCITVKVVLQQISSKAGEDRANDIKSQFNEKLEDSSAGKIFH